MNVTYNEEKNGIEIRFETKPAAAILSGLKEHGFRWSNKQRMWFAKKTDQRVAYVNELSSGCVDTGNIFLQSKENATKETKADLWELTRIDKDLNNVDKDLTVKEIAATVRKHIKSRFPMCKFSITCGGSYLAHSIDIDLLCSPFEKESEELTAILDYVSKYVNSYRYCTDYDPYGDYGSSYNFYGVFSNNILSYSYQKREATEEENRMIEEFKKKKAEFDEAEMVREEAELEEAIKRSQREEEEYKARLAAREKNHELIENAAQTKDAKYFAINVFTTNTRKEDSIDGYFEDVDGDSVRRREICMVSREVYFSNEMYGLFSNQLMDDYSFLAGMGGSRTDDYRINSNYDFQQMSEPDRNTVEWYNINCVAVYADDELKCIIDPQGFDYARYVYFLDEESKIQEKYESQQIITKEEYEANCGAAESLEDISFNVIVENNLRGTWNSSSFDEYKYLMLQELKRNNFKLNAGVVRAIKEDGDFKIAMYKLLHDIEGIQYQFDNASLSPEQKITIINMHDFGGISLRRVVLKSYEFGNYAQHKAVKLIVRPEGKRKDHYMWLYGTTIVYNGWIDIPEDLLWEIKMERGMVTKKSKLLSCDYKQYDVIIEHFRKSGCKPIINTYNSVLEN